MCPQKSGKEHCSLDEALNPAVSSAVLASCRGVWIKNIIFKNWHYKKVKQAIKLLATHTWLLCWALY